MQILIPLLAFIFLQSSAVGLENYYAQEQEKSEAPHEKPWWLDRSGKWDITTELDWTMGSFNPQIITMTGKADTTTFFEEKYLLTYSIVGEIENITIEGYNEKDKDFWAISLDSNRTPFTYVSGKENEGGTRMKLKDPFNVYSREEYFLNEDTFKSIGYMRENEFMEITQIRKKGKPKNNLESILKGPKKPKRVNKIKSKPDAAENYADEHEFMQILVGDFKTKDKQKVISARRVCGGRFIIASITEEKEKEDVLKTLLLIGFDNSRKVFQMWNINNEDSPAYLEGTYIESIKTLSFKNPFQESEDEEEIQFIFEKKKLSMLRIYSEDIPLK